LVPNKDVALSQSKDVACYQSKDTALSQSKDVVWSQLKDTLQYQSKEAVCVQSLDTVLYKSKDVIQSQLKDAPQSQLKDAPWYQSKEAACYQSKDLVWSLLMDEARSIVTDAVRSLLMDEAGFLTTDAARSLLKDGVASLTTEVAGPLLMDMAQSLVIDQELSPMIDEEIVDNQPNLLKQHFGPSNFRLSQKNKQRNSKDIRKTLVKTKTANFDRSCLCSVLKHDQIAMLKSKGMVFIEVNQPVRKMEGKAEVVYWSLADQSLILSDIDFSELNICVVTAYKNIKDDKTLAYVGAIKGRLPDDDDNIILTMILQSVKENLGEKIDIHKLFVTCKEIKLNINKGSLSKHFKSVGGNYGTGACRKYFVKNNLASFGQFFSRKEKKKKIYSWKMVS